MNYTIPSNESYYKWLPLDKYGDAHPEYFPIIGGKRHIPPPVASGPKRADPPGLAALRVNPDVAGSWPPRSSSFPPEPGGLCGQHRVNDGYGDCTCDKCHAMTPQARTW
jgi:hypothetical protein